MRKLLPIILCLMFCLSSCRTVDAGGGDTTQTGVKVYEPKNGETVQANNSISADDGKTVICIDPGHGFDDVGCTSDDLGCYEYEITLPVSLKLKKALEEMGAEVILTHDGSSFPSEKDIIRDADKLNIEYIPDEIKENNIFSAYERAIYAEILNKKYGLDFFISLHVNSVENADYVSGYSIDYYKGNPFKIRLADFCNALSKKLKGEWRIFEDEFENAYKVTKYAAHPAVLFEMGYATNRDDAKNLRSDKWQNDLVKVLSESIMDFISPKN